MESLKTFEQLTDNELIALTQEQIDWYIKLKKAEAGIRIVARHKLPELREIPAQDMVLYDICKFNFINREDAEESSKLINSKIGNAYQTAYDYSAGYDRQYGKPFTGTLADVKMEKVYSETAYNSIKDILISNKKIQSSYEELKSEYDEVEEKSSEIVNNIYDKIREANGRKDLQEEYIIRIHDYLRLANGDVTIAWNFFEKAYEIEPSVKNKILEDARYIETVEGYK
jgi:hypothetical protein